MGSYNPITDFVITVFEAPFCSILGKKTNRESIQMRPEKKKKLILVHKRNANNCCASFLKRKIHLKKKKTSGKKRK